MMWRIKINLLMLFLFCNIQHVQSLQLHTQAANPTEAATFHPRRFSVENVQIYKDTIYCTLWQLLFQCPVPFLKFTPLIITCFCLLALNLVITFDDRFDRLLTYCIGHRRRPKFGVEMLKFYGLLLLSSSVISYVLLTMLYGGGFTSIGPVSLSKAGGCTYIRDRGNLIFEECGGPLHFGNSISTTVKNDGCTYVDADGIRLRYCGRNGPVEILD